MSVYHLVFFLLLAGAVAEHFRGKTPKFLFALSFLALAALLCLRFGQGSDYFSYASIYRSIGTNPIQAFFSSGHTEPGWKMLCSIFQALGAVFPVFIFFLSLYMMVMLLRFVNRFGGNRKCLMLVLCHHTLYMTYFMSGLRQAVVVVTFLAILLPWLLEGKYIRYFVGAALLISIHTVALALFLMPLIKGLRFNFRQLVALVAAGFMVGILLSVINVGLILRKLLKVYTYYLTGRNISIFAILERVASFAVVTLCLYVYMDGIEPKQNDPMLVVFKIYCLGLFIYGVLMWSQLISSRTIYVFKIVEVVLLCTCIDKCKKSRTLVFLFCIILSSVLYFKNIGSYLTQGGYKNASIINYPYVTVFNQTDILNYREDVVSYPF